MKIWEFVVQFIFVLIGGNTAPAGYVLGILMSVFGFKLSFFSTNYWLMTLGGILLITGPFILIRTLIDDFGGNKK